MDAETRYRLLLEISRKISHTLEMQDLLDEILLSVRAAVPYDAAGVFVLKDSVPLAPGPISNVIAGMAQVGFEGTPDDPMLRSGQGIVGHVIRTGETRIVSDVREDPNYVMGREATRSEIAVPIVSNACVIGALNLESDRPGAFTEADAELLQFFAGAAAIAIEKAILHRQGLEKQRLEQQLRLARDVQASLLPSLPPELPGYDIAAVHLPTWEIGGDYYDYVPLPGGRLGVVIADVSGKGIPAALIMATFRGALRTALRGKRRIVSVVQELNRMLIDAAGSFRFVTAVFGILDPRSGRLDCVNCGHNPPLLLRADGGRTDLDPGGPALGIFPDATFEPRQVVIEPGDTLVLYTDGVTELADAGDEEFGLERLAGRLRSAASLPAGDIVLAVVDATRGFSGRTTYEDDFTLVVLKRDGLAGRARYPEP